MDSFFKMAVVQTVLFIYMAVGLRVPQGRHFQRRGPG